MGYTLCLFWTLAPKRVTRILPDLQTKHNSDKACHEEAKYSISLILTYYLEEKKPFEIFT